AELYAQKAIVELEVNFLRQTVSADNSELARKQLGLNVLNQKTSTIPDLGLEHLRLFRSILIQSKILEVMIPLLEQARLEEQRETPSIAVLDRAVPAEKKAKPKRMLIVALAALSSIILSISIFAVWQRLKGLQATSPERFELLRALFRIRNSQ
ncbi:MAG: GNVR domain-containing protein, partial [Bacteroidota bacterium]